MTDLQRAGHSLGMTGASIASPAQLVGATLDEAQPVAMVPPSFDEVYAEHFPFVWRSLRRMGVAEAAIDDAVQDVFLVVHRRLPDFEARSSVKTWLFGIVHRVAHDHRRRVARKGGLEPLAPTLADRGPGPLEQLEAHEALRELDAALSALDVDKRAVLVLTEIEQMTAPEIAEALGVNLNTVYSRLRAARRELDLALSRRRRGGAR